MKKDTLLSYEIFENDAELTKEDLLLLSEARKITAKAYAPYSKFLVGAAGRLANGNIVTGTNQENASYPVGICAERVLLSSASMLHTNEPLLAIAISYDNTNGVSNHPISPCGICRQSLVEYESRTNTPIRLILSGQTGQVIVIPTASMLLPLSFGSRDMR